MGAQPVRSGIREARVTVSGSGEPSSATPLLSRERTIHYCAYYENGVASDGSPDPSTVKRRSKTPSNSLNLCEPVACTAGRIGEACGGGDDHASCDSAPDAGDGECDACVATGGNSTEDEMFILLGAYYVDG